MVQVPTTAQRCAQLLLVSDDLILADFFRETVGTGLGLEVETASTRQAAARLSGLGPGWGLVLDQRAFDEIEPELGEDRGSVPLVLVTGLLDRTTVRRLLAVGGTAIVPTSYERARFLNALGFALAGEYFFPPPLWMPYLEETLAPGLRDAPRGSGALTRRELDVLSELARGKTNKAIAFSLGISEPTVKMHLAHLGKKLSVGNRTQLLTRAIRQGLIPDLAMVAEPDRAAE